MAYQLEDLNREWKRIYPDQEEKIELHKKGLSWVTSSCISGVGIVDEDLLVGFWSGWIYRYKGYASYYRKFMQSNSKGQFFNRYIRKNKDFTKSKDLPQYNGMTEADVFKSLDEQFTQNIIKNIKDTANITQIPVVVNGVLMNMITVNGLVFYRPVSQ